MSANASSSSVTLAKLTSISTLTLSLLLERQRAQTLPSFSPSPNPSHNAIPIQHDPLSQNLSTLSSNSSSSSSTPTPAQGKASLHLAQITKNLTRLREGILELERMEGRTNTEATRLLRTQYERMRGMLGDESGTVESLQDEQEQEQKVISPQPTVPNSNPKVLAEPTYTYTPYTDEDPGAAAAVMDNEDDHGILLQQRRMMD
ncbi:hypothetical protein C0993_011060, partial [Termitomyces sp. T159_Od127]